MGEYPEHERMMAIKPEADRIAEFLEWVEYHDELTMAVWDDEGELRDGPGIETILADYFSIDLKKIQAEKDEMIRRLRDG